MSFHQQSDYGPNPHAGANRNNAAERGWGSGWPDCDKTKQVKVKKAGVMVVVRREIAELVAVLFEATEKRHRYDIRSGQTWGFACRAIRESTKASNHSWGLAVDINSPANPMQSTFKSDMPPSMVKMWEACGFYWGGRYTARPDAMHYEYIFRAADVPGHLRKAKAFLAGGTIAGAFTDTGPNISASPLIPADPVIQGGEDMPGLALTFADQSPEGVLAIPIDTVAIIVSTGAHYTVPEAVNRPVYATAQLLPPQAETGYLVVLDGQMAFIRKSLPGLSYTPQA